ncbi:MAG: CDP-glycerol glycerophosphotransferase family protein, partial [Acetatifactor sp.]|nr:CDP-glycerol glycerophosphotransferase family protein [Acetatifactor sp.]
EGNGKKTILIGPSWQKDNILDSCIEGLLEELKGEGYRIIVRPHPQYVRHFEGKIDALAKQYAVDGIEVQKDFSSNKTVYMADVLVTDWSSIAFEYAFSTLKPVLFINTPMKVVNSEYQELQTIPIDLVLRDKVGISLEPGRLEEASQAVHSLLYDNRFSTESLAALRDTYIYNVGSSGVVGARYIIEKLVERQQA